jgi:hypothetical protein
MSEVATAPIFVCVAYPGERRGGNCQILQWLISPDINICSFIADWRTIGALAKGRGGVLIPMHLALKASAPPLRAPRLRAVGFSSHVT